MTIKELFEVEIAKSLAKDPKKAASVSAVIGFDITGKDGGYWTVDCTKKGEVSVGRTKEPAMTVKVDSEDLLGLYEGRLNAMALFFSGKIKVEGDMGLALKLKDIL